MADLTIVVNAKDQASKVLQDIEKSAGGFGKVLGEVSKIAGGFVLGTGLLKAPDFLASAAQAAADDAASMARLQKAVENTGRSWDEVSAAMAANIKLGQDLGFTDDQTRDSLSLLAAQTGDTEEAVIRWGYAMDLARGANIDVVTASRLLGKVTEENVNVLARYGIKVKEGASETELFGAIQEKFGGQAKVFADSTAGQMARLKDRMAELKETIGGAIMPVMTAVVSLVLTKAIPALEKLANLVGPVLGSAFRTIAPVVQNLARYFGVVASEGDAMNDFLANLPGPMQGIVRVIGELVGHLILLGQALFVSSGYADGLSGTWLTVYRVLTSVGAAISTLAGQVAGIVKAVAAWVIESGLLGTALTGLKTIGEGLGLAMQALGPIIQTVVNFLLEHKIAAYALVAVLGAVVVAMAPIPIAIAAIILAVGALREHWDEIKAKAIEVWSSIPGPIKEALSFIRDHVTAVIEGIIQTFQGMWKVISGVVALIVDLFHGRWSEAWEDLKQIAAGALDILIGNIKTQFGNIPGIILSFVIDVTNAAISLGAAIVDGVWKGIESAREWFTSQVTGFFKGIISSVKSVLGIGSPSKVGIDIGRSFVQGVAIGMRGLGDVFTPAIPSPLFSGGSAGATNMLMERNRPDHQAPGGGIMVNFNGPSYFGSGDATRSAEDAGWGIAAAARARGLMVA